MSALFLLLCTPSRRNSFPHRVEGVQCQVENMHTLGRLCIFLLILHCFQLPRALHSSASIAKRVFWGELRLFRNYINSCQLVFLSEEYCKACSRFASFAWRACQQQEQLPPLTPRTTRSPPSLFYSRRLCRLASPKAQQSPRAARRSPGCRRVRGGAPW
jgi:hypothetical protein